ncbi:MAG: hypothetical protein GXP31_07155 [Kiritimatiellaeota bacterium]|nr:hypothetical protein [Kiritimatiellota bacterium]
MNEPNREGILDRLTEPLQDDPELRLDVRAELAAHLEDKACELREQGTAAEAARNEALRALGAPAEIGADLLVANRPRMKRRARIRLALRALAVPLAIVAALWCAGMGQLLDYAASVDMLTANAMTPPWLRRKGLRAGPKPFTPEQELVLHGDRSRKGRATQQRAIWERWPDNLTYLRNYATYLLVDYGQLGESPTERLKKFESEMRMAMRKDPENARYHHLLAAKMLEQAAEIKKGPTGKAKADRRSPRYRLEVKDRDLLDRAMAEFRKGLAKPMLRRGAAEMLSERLRILGPPRRRLDQIRRIALAAAVLLPDLAVYRNLARAAGPYAGLLVAEHRKDDAAPFLDAWEKLALQLNDDAFTLIDELVVLAVIDLGSSQAAEVCERAGTPDRAEAIRHRAEALGAVIRDWRRSVQDKTHGEQLKHQLRQHAGILSSLLLPALGSESLSDMDALAPDRLLDYTLAEEGLAGAISLTLLALMLGALGAALWRRLLDRKRPPPLYLLPDARSLAGIVLFGIAAPALVYVILTHWTSFGGREYSLPYQWPRFMAQATVLLAVVTASCGGLAASWARRRCEALGLPCPRPWPTKRMRRVFTASVFLLFLVSLLPAEALSGTEFDWATITVVVLSALVGVMLFLRGAVALAMALCAPRDQAFYRGTLARSLVPMLAVAVMAWSAVSRPWLIRQEGELIRRDTLMSTPSEGLIGFTSVEAHLARRLKQGVEEAAKQLGSRRGR